MQDRAPWIQTALQHEVIELKAAAGTVWQTCENTADKR